MLDRWTTPAVGVPVDVETARRIAVRAQGLDGSQSDVLETVRRLGFLQLDPISSVAPPQQLVLWSRLGRFDTAELDRLLWEEKKLVEWRAFVYPMEDLPILKAFMRRTDRPLDDRRRAFLRANTAFSRYVLKELRERGPLLSREIETHASRKGTRAARVVGLAADGADARDPRRGREGRRRRPPRQAARLGSRRALVSRTSRRSR